VAHFITNHLIAVINYVIFLDARWCFRVEWRANNGELVIRYHESLSVSDVPGFSPLPPCSRRLSPRMLMPPRAPIKALGGRTVWLVPISALTREVRSSANASPICTIRCGQRRIWTRPTNPHCGRLSWKDQKTGTSTSLVSLLAPDIAQAILDGRQPRDLTADKLLAHSRLPQAWPEQRTTLGFAWARSELKAPGGIVTATNITGAAVLE
jgi:hypothetical protein